MPAVGEPPRPAPEEAAPAAGPVTSPAGPVTSPGGPASSGPRTSSLAVASLVLGIVGGSVLAIVLGLIARARIRRSGGALTGRTLATIGIALGFVWLAITAVVVALAVSGVLEDVFEDEPNADRFSGVDREVATAIDDFEAAAEDERFDEVCDQIFTPRFEGLIVRGVGSSCQNYYEDELGGRNQLPIEVHTIDVRGTRATVEADEGGQELTIGLVDEGGRWRIDDIR